MKLPSSDRLIFRILLGCASVSLFACGSRTALFGELAVPVDGGGGDDAASSPPADAGHSADAGHQQAPDAAPLDSGGVDVGAPDSSALDAGDDAPSPDDATPPDDGPAPTRVTFQYTGGPQSFAVPAGITQVTIFASGAAGGAGQCGGSGGYGGTTTASIAVTPGETLAVFVGGAVAYGHLYHSGAPGTGGGGY